MFVQYEKPWAACAELFLKPRETIYVPLKYQTFDSIQQPFGNKPMVGKKALQTTTLMLEAKTIKVFTTFLFQTFYPFLQALFKRADTGELVNALLLQVEPQPQVLHQTFRFYHPENTFLVKYIRVNIQQLQGET